MDTNNEFAYRNLVVYQHAKAYAKYVYQLMDNFPHKEEYALCAQLRRSSISVPSNIAEACGRYSKKQQLHFLEFAFGSLNETVCQMEIACDFNYIDDDQMHEIEIRAIGIKKMLSGWRKTLISQLSQSPKDSESFCL
jgi:four helix bundle protein